MDSAIRPLRGPGVNNWDLSVFKKFRLGDDERRFLQMRLEMFNAFNHPQFGNPATNLASPSTFGRITSTSVNPRLIQLALKYVF